jgi:uncharacterized protein
MHEFVNIFWNSNEHRLRGLLRLGIQVFFLFIVSLILGTIFLFTQGFFNSSSAEMILSRFLNSDFNVINALMTLVTIFIGVWLGGKWLDHRKWADFGFHLSTTWFTQLSFGLALGAILMTGIFLIELAAGWVSVTGLIGGSSWKELFKALAIYLSVGIYEELYFRGYLLRNLAETFNFGKIGARNSLIAAWLISSVIFGLLHNSNPNATMISTFNIFLAGIFLALAYVLTGELALSIGLHITWNFFQGFVFGFPVSGASLTSSIFQIKQTGPATMTGGAFGPEAGLIGIIAILVGCGIIIFLLRGKGHRSKLNDALAIYQPPTRTSSQSEIKP